MTYWLNFGRVRGMISSTINNIVLNLKPREREVLTSRFGLTKKERETLAGLGERYGITRERVRQIEAEALRRLKEEIAEERLREILDQVLRHLNKMGGARKEDLLIEDLKNSLRDADLHALHLRFLEAASDQPRYYFEDEDFYPFWYVDEETVRKLTKFVNYLERTVSQKKEDLIMRGKFSDYLAEAAKTHQLSEPVALNYLSISRKFKSNPFGDFGLSAWEEIDPRTMGSKAYIVIKKKGKPIHFREVASEINKTKFDNKKALPQTIHNELIKDPRFVLVGRGIYGLKEQGFVPGVVREVITMILRKEGPLTPEKILNAVAKQRRLERNTIMLNLQNKKFFKRLPDGRYTIAKA